MTFEKLTSAYCQPMRAVVAILVLVLIVPRNADGAGITSTWSPSVQGYFSHFVYNNVDDYSFGVGSANQQELTSGYIDIPGFGFFRYYQVAEFSLPAQGLLPNAKVSAAVYGTHFTPEATTQPRPTGPNTAIMSAYRGNGKYDRELLTRASTPIGTVNASVEADDYWNGYRFVSDPVVTNFDITAAAHAAKGASSLGLRYNPNTLTSAQFYAALEVTDDPWDILRAGTMTETYSAGSPVISAVYQPGKTSLGRQVPLDELAKALGFDHFNWRQTISGPGNWTWQQIENPQQTTPEAWSYGGANEVVLQTPTVDMPVQRVGNDLDRYVIRVDGNGLNDVREFTVSEHRDSISPSGQLSLLQKTANKTGDPTHDGPSVDGYEFYYSEDDYVTPPGSPISIPEWQAAQLGSYTMRFEDKPVVPDFALAGSFGVAAPNYFVSFVTELVGVNEDGTAEPLAQKAGKLSDGNSLVFSWKSNSVSDTDTLNGTGSGGTHRFGYLGQGRNSVPVAVSSGGVFDLRFESVPEPGGIAIAAFTLSLLSLFQRRVRHRY